MSLLQRIRERVEGRHHLRRFSHEKARAVARGQRRAPIPQLGEKLCIGVVAGLLGIGLLGAGAADGVRPWLALFALGLMLVTGFVRYLSDFRRHALGSIRRTIGLATVLLLPLATLVAYDRIWGVESLSLLPLSFIALILSLAWGRALAIDCTMFSGVLLLLYLALRSRLEGPSIEGLAVAIGGALVAALASEEVKRRSSLFRIGLMVGFFQALLAATFLLVDPAVVPSTGDLGPLLMVGAQGIVVGLLVSGLLPAIEALFGVTTDISLLELGNTHEAPLLRKLLIEAPGTFHHSYVVGLISEASAEAVGRSPLLARVGALYHDIGKLNKPEYFAENSPEARDRHKNLAPEMSMLIISSHPRDGVELGRFYGLPQAILDFMPEHHGTALIEYFYHRAKKIRGAENVSEESFRYPGPKPQRVETAIVMIADAAEAIARQMPDPSQARLKEMVHEVALKRLMDGQFAECGMTLRDLDLIEAACVRVLSAIHHTRPTFPKGKPHPLDLSQPGEERRAVQAEEREERRRVAGGRK